MKKIWLIIFFLIVTAPSFSIDMEFSGWYSGITLNVPESVDYNMAYAIYKFEKSKYSFILYIGEDNESYGIPDNLMIKSEGNSYYKEVGGWNLKNGRNLSYLYLKSENEITYQEKFGILYSIRRLYLYNEDNKLFFINNDGKISEVMPFVTSVRSSSYLTEGGIKYSGNNLNDNLLGHIDNPQGDISIPWVENEGGQGIGSWIEMDTASNYYPVSSFLISNGYVNFEKPYLYEYNSRVKRLRITNEKLNIDFEVELEDTPNFQEIRLPNEITELETTFIFTIMEVYPGTKWEDTCLNLIIPLGDLPDTK